jgi:hypothetical protein
MNSPRTVRAEGTMTHARNAVSPRTTPPQYPTRGMEPTRREGPARQCAMGRPCGAACARLPPPLGVRCRGRNVG